MCRRRAGYAETLAFINAGEAKIRAKPVPRRYTLHVEFIKANVEHHDSWIANLIADLRDDSIPWDEQRPEESPK
ncbi:MAG TPA: hypothetical protein VFU07_06645 [Candidatus Lumbricidophila sp.]|nr:hypothetical protein [Candidatus Lumbricidophila sp.]